MRLLITFLCLAASLAHAAPPKAEAFAPLFELAGIRLLCEQSAPLVQRGLGKLALGLLGTQLLGQSVAHGLEGAGGAFAGQVLGTVHIGGTVLVIVGQRRNHRLRLLRSGGAVQIGLTFAGERGKGRKVGTPGRIKQHVGTVGWVERSDTHRGEPKRSD